MIAFCPLLVCLCWTVSCPCQPQLAMIASKLAAPPLLCPNWRAFAVSALQLVDGSDFPIGSRLYRMSDSDGPALSVLLRYPSFSLRVSSPLSRRHDHDAAGLPRWHHPHDAELAPLLGDVAVAEGRRRCRPCSRSSFFPPRLSATPPPPYLTRSPLVATRVPTVGRASVSFLFFSSPGCLPSTTKQATFFCLFTPPPAPSCLFV